MKIKTYVYFNEDLWLFVKYCCIAIHHVHFSSTYIYFLSLHFIGLIVPISTKSISF